MSQDSKNWVENLKYLHLLQNTMDLDQMPRKREDFTAYLYEFNNDIPMHELIVFLKRVHQFLPDDIILKNKIKEHLSKEKIITKSEFNKIWKKISIDKLPKIENKKSKQKEQGIKFTQKQIKQFEEFWKKPEKERYNTVNEILEFDIIGNSEIRKANLVFFLKFGDLMSSNLMNRVNYHGDPSAGKSFVADVVVQKLLPEENIMILDAGSDKIFRYMDIDTMDEKTTIFLREMGKDSNIVEDLKRIGDDNPIWQYVDFQQKKTITIKGKKVGMITTYSHEYTQRDYEDRAWNIIPDQSYIQTALIKKHKLEIRAKKLERYVQGKIIERKSEFFKNAIRYFKSKYSEKNVIIPFAIQLNPLFTKFKLRVRRDVDKLPALIETITLFNQNNRETFEFDGKYWVISEWEDLRKALEIGKDEIIKISLDLDQVKQDILDFMDFVEIVIDKNKITPIEKEKWYTLKEIHESIIETKSFHQNTTRNKLKSLIANGYMTERKKKGKATLYKKVKSYEQLELDIHAIKEDIIQIVDLYKVNYKMIIDEYLVKLPKE